MNKENKLEFVFNEEGFTASGGACVTQMADIISFLVEDMMKFAIENGHVELMKDMIIKAIEIGIKEATESYEESYEEFN